MRYIDNVPGTSLYVAHNMTAWGLITIAYDIHIPGLLIHEPSWAKTISYDVHAKADDETDIALAQLSPQQFLAEKQHMLRGLLADRFGLRIHSEKRTTGTYELFATERARRLMVPYSGEVGKTISTCSPAHYSRKGEDIEAKGCPFALLLNQLRGEEGTDVIDHTGMSGAYAYHLMFEPNNIPADFDEDQYPRLADAVKKQLGLELRPSKGPVTFWVIDHLQRPSSN